MKQFNYIYKFLNNYFTILLGALMFGIFVYFKFIRTRIPREIPFKLSIVGLFIIIMLCCTYGYLVFRHVKPAKNSNQILKIIIEFIFQPLDHFDDYIKDFKAIKTYYPKLLLLIAKYGLPFFKFHIYEIIFYLFPRTLLIAVFIIDIFVFSKLHYLYYMLVPMGLLLFLRRYFIYSLNKLILSKKDNIKLNIETICTKYEFGVHPSEWPENFDPNEEDAHDYPDTMSLNLEQFTNYYINKKVYNNEECDIKIFCMTDYFYTEYENYGKKFVRNKKLEIETYLREMLNLYTLTEYINISSNNNYIKHIKLLINLLYFICWSYILYVSLPTLKIAELFRVLNLTLDSLTEPFSELTLYQTCLIITKYPLTEKQQKQYKENQNYQKQLNNIKKYNKTTSDDDDH